MKIISFLCYFKFTLQVEDDSNQGCMYCTSCTALFLVSHVNNVCSGCICNEYYKFLCLKNNLNLCFYYYHCFITLISIKYCS